jgi:serine/threonine protein phosphatase PrpC
MEAKTRQTPISPDVLLQRFTRADFEAAKAKLLEIYRLWHGLLVSNDEQTVITPDDLENIKQQAADILSQETKSPYELEQLKILTVLIYLLMSGANETAIKADPAMQEKLETAGLTNGRHYILRKLAHNSADLSAEDIKKFIHYENLVLSSYITSFKANESEAAVLTHLKTQDGKFFNLQDAGFEINIEFVEAPAADKLPVIEVVEEPAKPEAAPMPAPADLTPLILNDEKASFLINNYQERQLRCGVMVAASSYIGLDRKRNEDAVAILPATDHVIVIDAMGGYGNGVIARDLFVEVLLQSQDSLEQAALRTQQHYDKTNLEQGGVCLTGFLIKPEGENFNIYIAQAGDVHALVYDREGELKYETVDESIGHLVINAIISKKATEAQRSNGWKNFGNLTKTSIRVKEGSRLAVYSDGVGNHFKAKEMGELILNKTRKQAIAAVSKALDEKMHVQGAYKDNSSIAIIDF